MRYSFKPIESKEFGDHMFKHLGFYQKNELVFRQNQLAKKIYLVKSGFIKIFRSNEFGEEYICDILGEGALVAEWDMLSRPLSEHRYSAAALSHNTEVEAITVSNLDKIQYNILRLDLLPIVLEELKKSKEREDIHKFGNSKQKIIHMIKYLSGSVGKKCGDQILVKIPLSHQDLAYLADCSRQTMTSALAAFKKEGLLKYSRGRFLIHSILVQSNKYGNEKFINL